MSISNRRVNGIATPFPGFLPVCRCISDEGLRDFRCALMHPEHFLFRNLPTPMRVNQKFKVKWTLVEKALEARFHREPSPRARGEGAAGG